MFKEEMEEERFLIVGLVFVYRVFVYREYKFNCKRFGNVCF